MRSSHASPAPRYSSEQGGTLDPGCAGWCPPMANDLVPSDPGEFLFYQTEDGRTRLQVRMEGETVWLSQKAIADLFQKDVRTISEHVRNIFEKVELRPEAVVRNFRITAADNKSYDTQHYNLDVIISVGYRVESLRGTQFHIWATQRLREYIVKGFAMDDERLKQAECGHYFDELLGRIHDIHSSERVFWRKVLDIYATSIALTTTLAQTLQRFSSRPCSTRCTGLSHARTISHETARLKAESEYEAFRTAQVALP